MKQFPACKFRLPALYPCGSALLVLIFGSVPWTILPAPVFAADPGNSAMQAQAVLKRTRDACGGAAWDKVSGLALEGSQNSAGMKGNFRGLEDVRTGRIRRESDYHVIDLVEVWDGIHHWRQDMSGGVHELNSEFSQQANVTDEWLARRAYMKPDAESASLGPAADR